MNETTALVSFWQSHAPILPVLLPFFSALVLLLIGDSSTRLRWARGVAGVSLILGLVISVTLLRWASTDELLVYHLGAWPAPFGIVLVVDRLSALMLVLCYLVALPAWLYASAGWDTQGRYFHALFQFQLMGLSGAFVTGDLFNLFVFFEILLIASYVLLMHGQGRERLRAGVPYVILNLVASALFLIGASLIYAGAGTLNLAHLAIRVPQLGGAAAQAAQWGAAVLLVVFGFKAALMPLSLWLPGTYSVASAPIAALFAIMTKVGVYALWRVHGVVFGSANEVLPTNINQWLLPIALITCTMGAVGALAAPTLTRMVAWLTIGSVGVVLIALGGPAASAWSAGLFYMAHSTLVIAGLFLLAERIASQRGAMGDQLVPGPSLSQPIRWGLLMLLGAVSVVGLPPLSGFIGKTLLLQASATWGSAWVVWLVVLGCAWLGLIGLSRAGSILFWQTQEAHSENRVQQPAMARSRLTIACTVLLSMGILMSVFASPIARYTQAAATQLQDRAAYAKAVLGVKTASEQDALIRSWPVPSRSQR
jgi:multicomponent K+:H+ antiporter subunit D